MTATLQRGLDLRDARLKRPAVNRNGARAMLDVEDWQLDSLVDTGAVRGVVDIASPGAERRELRFAVVCLEEYRRCQVSGSAVQERSDAEIAELLFGAEQKFVRAHRVYRALNCKHSHFYSLTVGTRSQPAVLPLARGSVPRTGPGGSACVEWSALLNFIQARRLS